MTLGELMPTFTKFHCNVTTGIDGATIYKGNAYPIAIDEKRGKVRITYGEVFLFSTLEELQKYGTIE